MNLPIFFTSAVLKGDIGFLADSVREVFKILHGYNLAWGLAIHTRFDDLDLISRSRVCQNYKQYIVFRFLSTVV